MKSYKDISNVLNKRFPVLHSRQRGLRRKRKHFHEKQPAFDGGAFVAQIVIEYRERKTDGEGNVSYAGDWKSWYTPGYCDILQYGERSVDLVKDSNIPDGSQVRLHVYVAAGYSNPSIEQYIYDKTAAHQAVYEISGTTLNNYLKLVSYG